MHRVQKYADDATRRIFDPFDRTSRILGAYENDEVVGTVRTNFLRETEVGDYFDYYELSRLGRAEIECCSITTRLMIAPRHRKGTLAIRLIKGIYKHALERGIKVDLIDCNDQLVPFFTRLGYRIHRENLLHPEYGQVTVMKLDVTDRVHLGHVGSVFLPVLNEWTTNPRIIGL